MPRKNEPTERLCVVSRETMPIDRMIRFVLGPDGAVVPDLRRKLPGRGVWVEATRKAVETAVRKKMFGRGFGEEVRTDPGLADLVERLLGEAALGALGLARKAGDVILGFAKVEAAVRSERIAGLVHASEAGDDGVHKLAAALRRRFGDGDAPPVVRSFSGAQLDLALGRSNVIHAAVLAGRAGTNFIERHRALERWRGGMAVAAADTDRMRGGDAPQD